MSRTYCPRGVDLYILCPLGYYGVPGGNENFTTHSIFEESCVPCSPGEYGSHPWRTSCDVCPPGYVCLGQTTSSSPEDRISEKGYLCPKGFYCPEGSSLEIACPPGTYGPNEGQSSLADCLPCPSQTYQEHEGSSTCFPCSSSSYSEAGSISCTCIGLNRVFQATDKMCICETGYEFFDENYNR